MKKVFAAAVLVAVLLLLAGCSPKLAKWSIAEEKENGIYVLVTDYDDKNHQWYANVDTTTEQILSVNLIYPAEYGEPTSTSSSGGGKIVTTHQADELKGGGVIFYTLPVDSASLKNGKKITITQSFQNKEGITVVFKPTMVEEAFHKEY